MRPEQKSQTLLAITRSKAKMIEYGVPEKYQEINLKIDPAILFTLSIGILGDLAARSNSDDMPAEELADLRRNLQFSAHFFDAYLRSKFNENLDYYLILLGAASYYLCDLPGSSRVLAYQIGDDCPDLEGEGLETLLLWLLQDDLSTCCKASDGLYGDYVDSICSWFIEYYKKGTRTEDIINSSDQLRRTVYAAGTPRQLLLGDVVSAIIRKKQQNSCWYSLPKYSGLSIDKWRQTLQKKFFIKELWPAQHLLGQSGVLRGESAVVQMPTSAGKTRATEIIIRSAFLSNRTTLAIIIAPFRALCHEIKNSLLLAFHGEPIKVDELSDVLQTDFNIAELTDQKQILVVTPEKLLYVLRQAPELAANVGLLIFDEGHQFDSGTRGITYELLLTSLSLMLPPGAQKVLVSAVISNAQAVGEWLNGADSMIVIGTNLVPTLRSIGFVSWLDTLGRIEYVSSENAENGEFFVPRVIESFKLHMKPRETKERIFPEKSDGQSIALYLGLKLVSNGSVAIFCGRKSTASTICDKAVDAIERGIPLHLPNEYSDQKEMKRLHYLHSQNLGSETAATKSAKHGIFPHHGNTPHGIRLAVEHAMREGLIRFVVCTSTLAQGVNLPIRYLIVTSVYQGQDRIKVRDFHNLIGRAGRSGLHTEGSILFADPVVYDKRKNWDGNWRWEQVKELLDPSNSEPCISNLLSLFEPIKSDDGKDAISIDAMDIANAYIRDPNEVATFAREFAELHADKHFSQDGVTRQISWKISLISSIESFLLSNWDTNEDELIEKKIIHLADKTLAYFLADEAKRKLIHDLFRLLANNISQNVGDAGRRKAYGRTLYGMRDAQAIEAWLHANIKQLLSAETDDEILAVVWPVLASHVHNGIFNRCDQPFVLQEVAREWIQGKPFNEIFWTLQRGNAKLIWGTKRREFKIDHVVEICESGLAYDGSLLIGALCEFVDLSDQSDTDKLFKRLQLFQKKLKYGLPTYAFITLYELGFSDRSIVSDLAISLGLVTEKRKDVIKTLKSNKDQVLSVLDKYPRYFIERFDEFIDAESGGR